MIVWLPLNKRFKRHSDKYLRRRWDYKIFLKYAGRKSRCHMRRTWMRL